MKKNISDVQLKDNYIRNIDSDNEIVDNSNNNNIYVKKYISDDNSYDSSNSSNSSNSSKNSVTIVKKTMY